jgi:MerR family transcriptional regulator, heat shock protein HspR
MSSRRLDSVGRGAHLDGPSTLGAAIGPCYVNGAGGPSPSAADRFPVEFPDETAALYTVGQVAAMLGVQPAFLRRLDVEQVVQPARSAGGQRRYSRVEMDRISAVAGLMRSGMTLAGASRILDLEQQVSSLQRRLDDQSEPSD